MSIKYTLNALLFEWQPAVLDKDLNTPPGSPAKGDRYIVGSSPTGAWSGQAGNIAFWKGSAWEFIIKTEGMFCYVKDEDKLYQYITSWTKFSLADIVEDTTPQLGGDLDMNEKNIDWDAIPSSDDTGKGDITDDINAGTNVTFPNLVYLASDGEWGLADADAVANCQGLLGIALETKSDGQACKVLIRGFVRDDDWNWTVGGTIYASTTAGGLTQTAPSGTDDVILIVGVATHADRIYFNPIALPIEHN